MSVSRHFFRIVIVCGITLSAVSFANEKASASTELKAFPAYYESEQVFITAAKNAKLTIKPLSQRITGLTLPHHVPAVSMMAEALQLAATQRYSRIVIICPDHYARGSQLCSTTERDFLTASGRVTSDRAAVRLLKKNADVADSNLFSHEHGILSILPLLHLHFPQTPVVAIALNARSNEADWQRMSAAIQPIIEDDTLLIQSTDFSHYLPWDQAKRRDQETLNQLCSGDPSRIATLIQPDHLDSKCCQWVQADLQKKCYRVKAPVVIDNRNVTQCGAPANEPRTTSYITQLWCRDEVLAHQLPGEAWFFGGDVFFGR